MAGEDTGDATISLDFGDGTGDNPAVKTENGASEEIILDFRMSRGLKN